MACSGRSSTLYQAILTTFLNPLPDPSVPTLVPIALLLPSTHHWPPNLAFLGLYTFTVYIIAQGRNEHILKTPESAHRKDRLCFKGSEESPVTVMRYVGLVSIVDEK
jgi:hypothetical protein